MTSRFITIEIRVSSIVQKYLSHHYGTDPFMLSNSNSANAFSSYLYNCLDRYNHYDTKVPKRYDKLTADLCVGIPEWAVRSGRGVNILPAKVSAFNAFAQKRFYEAMTVEITLRTAQGKGLVETTERILNRYGFTEDELSLLKALRYYARYKEKMFANDVY